MSPPNIAVYELTLGNDKIAELAQGGPEHSSWK